MPKGGYRDGGTRPKGTNGGAKGGGNKPAGGPGAGDANGEGHHGAGPGRPKGMKSGEGKKATFRDLLAPHIENTAGRWLAIINDPGHPHHHTMILKHAELNREFKQDVDVTLRDAPLEDLTDEELAAIAARGRRASAAPEADQG